MSRMQAVADFTAVFITVGHMQFMGAIYSSRTGLYNNNKKKSHNMHNQNTLEIFSAH